MALATDNPKAARRRPLARPDDDHVSPPNDRKNGPSSRVRKANRETSLGQLPSNNPHFHGVHRAARQTVSDHHLIAGSYDIGEPRHTLVPVDQIPSPPFG